MSNTAPKLFAIERVDVGGESTLLTEASNYDYVRMLHTDVGGLTVDALEDSHARQYDYEVSRIIGRYTGSFTMSMELGGNAASVPSAATTDTDGTQAGANGYDHIRQLVSSLLGNGASAGYVDSGTVGASGSPTDSITVDDASGGLGSFGVGEPVCYATGNTALPYYVQWLTAIATGADPDVGTLLQTTPPHDPQGTTVWGGYVCWIPTTNSLDPFHDTALSGQTNHPLAFSFKLSGHDSDEQIKALGCQPIGGRLSFPLDGLPTLELTMGVASWSNVGSGGSPATGFWTDDGLVSGTAFPQPELCGQKWWCAYGATAAASLPIDNLEIEWGVTRNALKDGSKADGIGGWYTVNRRPRISFDVYRDYSEEITKFEAQTGTPWTFQMGSQPGKMFAIAVPNARIVDAPAMGESDGAVMSRVSIAPNYYTGDTGTATGIVPIDSAMRFAFI